MAKHSVSAESVPTNVVKLPTAAPRKVKQHWNKQTRAMFKELRKFPEDRTYYARFPWMRKAMEQARLIEQVRPTPELVIATAMFRALPEMERLQVQALVAMMGINGHEAAMPAVAWLDYTGGMMTFGDRHDIKRALERLASGRAE